MGVKAEVLPLDTDCHHFVLEVVDAFISCKFQQFQLTSRGIAMKLIVSLFTIVAIIRMIGEG